VSFPQIDDNGNIIIAEGEQNDSDSSEISLDENTKTIPLLKRIGGLNGLQSITQNVFKILIENHP